MPTSAWMLGHEAPLRDMVTPRSEVVEVAVSDAPSLSQLIWLVRRELEWARQQDADHPLQFEVGEVELEAALEVSDTRSKGGGVDLTVLGVGAKGELSKDVVRGTTATIKVTFTPNDRRRPGAKYTVSAEDKEPPPRRAGDVTPPIRDPESGTTCTAS